MMDKEILFRLGQLEERLKLASTGNVRHVRIAQRLTAEIITIAGGTPPPG